MEWQKKTKIKQSTLIGDYQVGGLKLPDFKIFLKASRIKQAIDLIFKLGDLNAPVPSKYLEGMGGLKHINVNLDVQKIPRNLPPLYKEVLQNWAEFTKFDPSEDKSMILNQYIWNNRYIKIDNKSIFYKVFASFNINRLSDLCDTNGEFKWEVVKSRGLEEKDYLRWAGVIHAIPKEWKSKLKFQDVTEKNKPRRDNCIQIERKNVEFEKLKTNQIYRQMVGKKFKPPSSQINIRKRIENKELDWEKIYGRIYSTTIDTYLRMFQYKILNNTPVLPPSTD